MWSQLGDSVFSLHPPHILTPRIYLFIDCSKKNISYTKKSRKKQKITGNLPSSKRDSLGGFQGAPSVISGGQVRSHRGELQGGWHPWLGGSPCSGSKKLFTSARLRWGDADFGFWSGFGFCCNRQNGKHAGILSFDGVWFGSVVFFCVWVCGCVCGCFCVFFLGGGWWWQTRSPKKRLEERKQKQIWRWFFRFRWSWLEDFD